MGKSMTSNKILLITGPDLRHQYYINHLNHNFDIAGIIIENSNYPEIVSTIPEEQSAWNWFFTRRKEYETKHFKDSEKLYGQNKPLITTILNSSLNSKETIKIINSIDPDLIAIFGSSIVGKELIERYPKSIFNLHIGLSNEYRGSSCNFWPIYERRADLLGATIIRINAGIDSGEILAQDNIDLEVDDDEQTLAGKTVKLGVALMIQTIKNWQANSISPLLPSKQFDQKAVFQVKQIVEKGELKQLIGDQLKKERKV
jgi:methionyl-tRNA formyltransferase